MANPVSGADVAEDDWDIDFDDTRGFLVESWKSANLSHALSDPERREAAGYVNSKALSDYLWRTQKEARTAGHHWLGAGLSAILLLARRLSSFESQVQELCDAVLDRESDNSDDVIVMNSRIDTSPLWQMTYLNIKFSMPSERKFKLTAKWMSDLRRHLELLVGAIVQANEIESMSDDTLRLELLEVFDPLMCILHKPVINLQRHANDDDFVRNWPRFMEMEITVNQTSIGDTIKHLREINANGRFDKFGPRGTVSEVGIRDRILPTDGAERAIFPVEMLPQIHAECFIGRQMDIQNIHNRFEHPEPGKIQKYTIYGRRGIGKTQLALEYARQYKQNYDAIFWIQSETKASLRQSFANIATKLELVDSDTNVAFSESLIRVLRWLRETQKKWLLIYDNAERSNFLTGYWPNGGQGCMLLTSRSFYNFFEDEHRQGETVDVFNDQERKELLLTLMGPKWQAQHLRSDEMLSKVEQAAIDTLLIETGGLPITIFQACKLIKDEEINPSQTIRHFMDLFRNQFNQLQKRHASGRDNLIKALDTVWAISFGNLSENAKTILQCISFLAPDRIMLDLFLPTDQSMLPDCLDFCRSTSKEQPQPEKSLQTYSQPQALRDAVSELVRKGLVHLNGKVLSIHRTSQEAIRFEVVEELQTRFEATINLLYDAFPKQIEGRPLQDDWQWCREWIPHVIQLVSRYKKYSTEGRLDGKEEDVPLKGIETIERWASLLANCAWYLYEISDYDEALNLVSVARNAIADKDSLLYAHLTNTEGSAYYDKNLLRPARSAFEICLEIRLERLPAVHSEIANVQGNLGNVETAEGNYEAALEYLDSAAEIRSKLGADEAVQLALTYMQIGRTFYLQDRDQEAYQMLQKSESMLNRKGAGNKLFMAHIHYDFGNLELKRGDLEQAAASFEKCRQFARAQDPLLPLTASANYKLGVVEAAKGHHKKAINLLNKALDIAETRNPSEIDGGVVRIQWKIAEVLLDEPFGDRREDALKLKHEAEHHRQKLADQLGITLRGYDNAQGNEKNFDLLVPGYFR